MKRALNWLTFLACFALIGLGFWTTVRIKIACNGKHLGTEWFMAMSNAAQELHNASEFLTQQSRQYVQRRNVEDARKYLDEVFHTRKRENALAVLYADKTKKIPGNDILLLALERSDILAKKEMYALRLAAEAENVPRQQLKELFRSTRLTSVDSALDADAKLARANELLFNEDYTREQIGVIDAIHKFLNICGERAQVEETAYVETMQSLINHLLLLFALLLVLLICRMALLFGSKLKMRGKGHRGI